MNIKSTTNEGGCASNNFQNYFGMKLSSPALLKDYYLP